MNANAMPDSFYVVTFPTPNSVLEDICFKTTLKGLQLQFKGGLDHADVYGIYFTQKKAEIVANGLLERPLR